MIQSPLLPQLGGFIEGHWVTTAKSDRTFDVHNPATGDLLASLPDLGIDETKRAIESADRAQVASLTLAQRRSLLERIHDALLSQRQELGRLITLEHGKPWPEAIQEVEYAASFFDFCAQNLPLLAPHSLSQRARGLDWTVHYRPAGVAAMITPWNFPIAMLAKKFAAALAADCSSVIKPSSKTPLTMIAFFHLLQSLNLPPGKANLIVGSSSQFGETVCAHPLVRVISFTGSTEIGKQLALQAAPHLKRLSLELGGNAPFIVFADADLVDACEQLIRNKFRGAGQTCVCTNRVLVEASVYDAFASMVSERVKQLRVGNGLETDVSIGPLIDRSAVDKVSKLVSDATAKGAVVLAQHDVASLNQSDGASFMGPVVLGQVNETMDCVRQETFGPVIPLMMFHSESQAIAMANDTDYGLAAYLFTADKARATRLASQLKFGHVGLNSSSGPVASAPFGGMKQSGYGREGGLEGMLEFCELQTIVQP